MGGEHKIGMQDPQGLNTFLPPPWIFPICPATVQWQADGVISRLVYIAICISTYAKFGTLEDKNQRLDRKLLNDAKLWLEAHSFPPQLIGCYTLDDIDTKQINAPSPVTHGSMDSHPYAPPPAK